MTMVGHSAAAQTIRIVQVSDTYVDRKRAYFVDNWDVFIDGARLFGPSS